ncbi:hypothetical protein RSAG8_12429, partial [Rhizoctonia solani AG-8 WAC10335]
MHNNRYRLVYSTGETFSIRAPTGATISVLGDVMEWASPLFELSGGNDAALTFSKVVADNFNEKSANSLSDGNAAGHNIDGFDVSVSELTLTIEDSTVINQDDCLAINKGSNIIFQRNSCSDGHGISVGSITSDVIGSISRLTLRRLGRLSGVYYSGKTVTGCTGYGVIMDQPSFDVVYTRYGHVRLGTNTVSVASGAYGVEINRGSGSCTGTWDWSGLEVEGGSAGSSDYSGIIGFTV